jgi:uncharacterized protein (TIGR04222 family)
MNPFDLPGPQFLLVYLVFGVLVNLAVRRLFRGAPDDLTTIARARQALDDPYRLACLRGGPAEAIRVAVFSLLDRGLLLWQDGRLVARDDARGFVRRPLEQSIVVAAARGTEVQALMEASGPRYAANAYRNELAAQGLVVDRESRGERNPVFWGGLALLGGVALLKIVLAMQRGKANIGFLLILAVVLSIGLVLAYLAPATGLGRRMLADQRTLFGGLKARAKQLVAGGASNDATWLAAAFGLSALPAGIFPELRKVFPKSGSDGSSGDGGGGSSCGSGGGSGCGGGGGCGGCGG